MIGERTAEEVKIGIGSALPLDEPLQMEVKGRDMIAGLPRTIPITLGRGDRGDRAAAPGQIITAVRNVLEQTPPELSSDIIDKGMVMTGGGVAASQHRHAADPGDRHPVPRGRQRAELASRSAPAWRSSTSTSSARAW